MAPADVDASGLPSFNSNWIFVVIAGLHLVVKDNVSMTARGRLVTAIIKMAIPFSFALLCLSQHHIPYRLEIINSLSNALAKLYEKSDHESSEETKNNTGTDFNDQLSQVIERFCVTTKIKLV